MPAKKPAKKMPPPRVPILSEEKLTSEQRALLDSIRSGPRGSSTSIRGPFAVFLHAPAFGELAQKLGGYCRFNTAVSPRLSEFAILVTAKLWRAQYEWYAHVPQAERAGPRPRPNAASQTSRPAARNESCSSAKAIPEPRAAACRTGACQPQTATNSSAIASIGVCQMRITC